MRIYLATDHAGFEHKEALKRWLSDTPGMYEVVDCGAATFDPDDDYPEYIAQAASAVQHDPSNTKAIIFGGSGQGEAMVANQFPHVRATVYYGHEPSILTLSREHNDANVLSIGARFVSTSHMIEAVQLWLTAPGVHDERHIRRLKKAAVLRP